MGVLPSMSAMPPELDKYAGVEEAAKRHGYAHQDSQSDCEVVDIPDCELDDTQATGLR